jgi:hypothetical protein
MGVRGIASWSLIRGDRRADGCAAPSFSAPIAAMAATTARAMRIISYGSIRLIYVRMVLCGKLAIWVPIQMGERGRSY